LRLFRRTIRSQTILPRVGEESDRVIIYFDGFGSKITEHRAIFVQVTKRLCQRSGNRGGSFRRNGTVAQLRG
jgi:hypothetical protein